MSAVVSEDKVAYAEELSSKLPSYINELIKHTFAQVDIPERVSGLIEGEILQTLIWASQAQRVLEIGTFTGVSALIMAEVLPAKGKLFTCEIDENYAKLAQSYFDKSPNGNKIEIKLGSAEQTMGSFSGEEFELIFIDADKTGYKTYYEKALSLLSTNGIIAIDNIFWGGGALAPKTDVDVAMSDFNRFVQNDPRVKQVILPIRDGLMLVRKIQDL